MWVEAEYNSINPNAHLGEILSRPDLTLGRFEYLLHFGTISSATFPNLTGHAHNGIILEKCISFCILVRDQCFGQGINKSPIWG